ncbi:hypothetical protein [Cohnella rhizosphaerae]|uniref:Uncharacterized protein n=1 Tax=Cohnella rhizosphaerae TaxID=1457232 RepID=A0A9X4QR55_9BACL|nr:hypothetical protein [Cohnella rhizosphaerae]MDG0808240.1 hypothetical protein [Cohnella rhizosphaerae]
MAIHIATANMPKYEMNRLPGAMEHVRPSGLVDDVFAVQVKVGELKHDADPPDVAARPAAA